MKKFVEWLLLVLVNDGSIVREAVDCGLVNHSGQGRDSYGR